MALSADFTTSTSEGINGVESLKLLVKIALAVGTPSMVLRVTCSMPAALVLTTTSQTRVPLSYVQPVAEPAVSVMLNLYVPALVKCAVPNAAALVPAPVIKALDPIPVTPPAGLFASGFKVKLKVSAARAYRL